MKKTFWIIFLMISSLFLLFLFFAFKEYHRFSNHLTPYTYSKPINIVFSGDDGYITPICTAITSLSLNTKTPVQVHLLTNGFSDKNQKKIYQLDQKLKNININIIPIPADLFKDFPINKRWNQAIYFRYLIPKVLENELKALYLDGDILILDDLSDFYHIDLKKKTIAGVQDYFKETFLSRPLFKNLSLYINSGVILMDMTQWRQKNMTQKLFELTALYQNEISYFDQDVINLAFKEDILPLSYRYNTLQGAYTPWNKVIYHYSGKQKPWKTNSIYYYEWDKYFAYMKAILNDQKWPLQSYLLYLFKKMIYYPSFIFKSPQKEA
ncbi:MAG: glycosyltransferase family 8 protein [Alphaproteobacteria bacterium]|nr:glycosyltransferase family 8 protein [Alphaproteobacteria bacterium]